MYSRDRVIDSKKFNIPDSFVNYTRLKGTRGSGEAKLFLRMESEGFELRTFFSNFREDNEYFFIQSNLLDYINNAAFEYQNQIQSINDVRGYKNNIFLKYEDFKQKILSLPGRWKISDIEEIISINRYYIRPKNLASGAQIENRRKHPWNFMRDIALPKLKKIIIEKVMQAENYAYYFLLLLDISERRFIYHNSPDLIKNSLEEINNRFNEGSIEKKRLVDAQDGRGFFREQVLSRMNKCQITGFSDPRYLEAAHIKPWTKSEFEEKIDGFNGMLLTPNCHKLFDRGMITFDDEGKLIKSNEMNLTEYDKLFIEEASIDRSAIIHTKTKEYLKWHREFVFEKFNNFEF